MFSLLFLALNLNIALISGFDYYPGPLSFDEAKQFCENAGSHLATIINDADRLQALSVIPDNVNAVWIGLEHEYGGPNGKCFFHYPAENDPTLCPLYPDYKCVGFWVHDKPSIISKGGFECGAFYPKQRNYNGGVDNDCLCDTKRPFLCYKSVPEICDVEEFVCQGSVTWCTESGQPDNSGPNGMGCFCDRDHGTGDSKCIANDSCRSAGNCNPANGNNDCPVNEVCITACCSGQPKCLVLCNEDAPNRRRIRRMLGGDDSTPPQTVAFSVNV